MSPVSVNPFRGDFAWQKSTAEMHALADTRWISPMMALHFKSSVHLEVRWANPLAEDLLDATVSEMGG